MPANKPTGTPFTQSSPDPIDEWSREVFEALADWAADHNGRWTRWDPGYLLLEIDTLGGEGIDPILIDTANEEVTVEFGYWEMHLPDQALDAAGAAREAIELASWWLSGETKTAVFTDDAGKWCGTKLIEAGHALPPEPDDGIGYFNPTRVELRGPRRSEWRSYRLGKQSTGQNDVP